MIEICNLSKQYDNQPLFKGLHLTITKGSVVTLIGPSGSGKSTLLRCMNGLESFQEGHISVNGQMLYGIHEQNYNKAQVHLTLKKYTPEGRDGFPAIQPLSPYDGFA